MMNNQKILLVNAPNPTVGHSPSGNYALFPSLGVISLATRLKKDYPNLYIKVIDGGIFTTKQILNKIDNYKPAILILSVLTPTYGEALKIAEYTKTKFGSIVVLGNDHASFFPAIILQKRPFIDFVVKSEIGEILLSNLVGYLVGAKDKLPDEKIGEDGIFYRKDSKIKRTFNKQISMSHVYKSEEDIPNMDFIRDYFHIYIKNYNKKYKKFHKNKKIPITLNTARGCKNWFRRCIYCSIYDLKPKWVSPKLFWLTIKRYHKKYGANFFFEVADEFLTYQGFIKDVVKTKPFELKKKDIEMEIYARADEIVGIPQAIEWLKELNITRVNLGLDSGDNTILELLRKKLKVDDLTPVEINYRAVKLLAENNITIHASFPIGCIGENKNSIKNTIGFIKRITKEFGRYVATLEVSELVPLPNSPSWDILLGKEKSTYYNDLSQELKTAKIKVDNKIFTFLQKKHQNQDLLDIKELSKDWIKYFTHISWSEVEKTKVEAEKIAKKIGAIYGGAI